MPIDHIGLGVPDVDAARTHYDEFMPLVGFVGTWDATFFVDMHGFMLEAVTYEEPGTPT